MAKTDYPERWLIDDGGVSLGVENIMLHRLDLNSTTCMWRAGTLTHNDPQHPEPCRYGHVATLVYF